MFRDCNAPEFGKLTRINAVYPHWLRNIEMNLAIKGSGVEGEITIPKGINAVFKWKDRKINLVMGRQTIRL